MDIVASLPESHLRAILVALCNDPRTHDRVISMASKLAAAPSTSGNGSDQAICVQCNQAFSVLTRAGNSCRYHPGKFKEWGREGEGEGEEEGEEEMEWRLCMAERRLANTQALRVGTRWADPSHEAWYDHYVNTDGPMETEENMEDWPDAFVWDCCQEPGSARGCKIGQHR